MIWFAALAAAAAGYIVIVRPLLRARPIFRKFLTEADGVCAKVWALSAHSVTLLWSYTLLGLGAAVQWIEPLGVALGDPEIKSQIADALHSSPELLGYVLIGIAFVTVAARLRTIDRA